MVADNQPKYCIVNSVYSRQDVPLRSLLTFSDYEINKIVYDHVKFNNQHLYSLLFKVV